MGRLILLRHGQSTWNAENKFTGWVDVDLSSQGEKEATTAGQLLTAENVLPDVLHTSLLIRAIRTAHIALAECGRSWISEHKAWELNERHYGALQGQNKAQAVEEFGAEQVKMWRRSYDVPPPPLDDMEYSEFANDPRYGELGEKLPRSECLADVVARTVPYYEQHIVSDLQKNRTVLVAAHGNSLRALVKHLESISDREIVNLEIPTGIPRVYETDGTTITAMAELGDPDAIAASRAANIAQTAK